MSDMSQLMERLNNCIPPTAGGLAAILIVFAGFVLLACALRFLLAPLGKWIAEKDRVKTRAAAQAIGFIVSDVERDAPDFDKKRGYFMTKQKCARYELPGGMASP